MGLHTFQVRLKSTTNMPEDDCVNVLHFRHADVALPADISDFAQNLAELYRDNLGSLLGGISAVDVTGYEVGPPPNYPQGTGHATTSEGDAGPREVALCLSYYADNNIPRRRGRIYLGPFRPAAMSDRPTGTVLSQVIAFAPLLDGMGGSDWTWRVYSPTSGEDHEVTNAWCDNAWDTQRRRGSAATARSIVSV